MVAGRMGASPTCCVTPAWDVNGQLVGLIVTTGGPTSHLVLLPFSHGDLVSSRVPSLIISLVSNKFFERILLTCVSLKWRLQQ